MVSMIVYERALDALAALPTPLWSAAACVLDAVTAIAFAPVDTALLVISRLFVG